MKSELLEIIKNLNGNIFTLGIIDKDLILAIQNNPQISHFLMLNINQHVEYEKSNNYKPTKPIKIKKIKKKNRKKRIDYTICEISDCKDHFQTLINDTIYFTKTKIFYYGKITDYDIELLIKKYRRYNVIIKLTKFPNDEFILEVDTTKAKTNKLKSLFYRIVDFFALIFNFLTEFLIS